MSVLLEKVLNVAKAGRPSTPGPPRNRHDYSYLQCLRGQPEEQQQRSSTTEDMRKKIHNETGRRDGDAVWWGSQPWLSGPRTGGVLQSPTSSPRSKGTGPGRDRGERPVDPARTPPAPSPPPRMPRASLFSATSSLCPSFWGLTPRQRDLAWTAGLCRHAALS